MPKGSSDPVGLGRILALSDGVFAIAMTVLVFSLRVPLDSPTEEGTAERILGQLSPRVVGFVISFALLGMFWMQHHRRFRWIRRYDDVLLWLNLVWLFFIVVIPFSTELVSQFEDDGTAAFVYSMSLTCTALASSALWWYASAGHRLVDADLPKTIVRFGTIYGLMSAVVFLMSGAAALIFGAGVARFLWFLPIPMSLVMEVLRHRHLHRLMAEQEARHAIERNARGRRD